MQITNLSPGGFASNCYLVTAGSTAVLIDCTAPAPALLEALSGAGAQLSAILLTHGHFDHMLTAAELREATHAPILLGAADAELPADAQKNAFSLFFGYERRFPSPDRLLFEGDLLDFGPLHFCVLHTPGHTAGSLVFCIDDIAFTGDTLFYGSYGRCDLYSGDELAMLRSLTRLSSLPHTTRIYPGHGESALLGEALRPFSQR